MYILHQYHGLQTNSNVLLCQHKRQTHKYVEINAYFNKFSKITLTFTAELLYFSCYLKSEGYYVIRQKELRVVLCSFSQKKT